MLIVKKFGGKALETKEGIFNTVKICSEDYNQGNDIILVLSARGNETDKLIREIKEINEGVDERELDMILATGEQKSVSAMASAFRKTGIPAVSLNAFQVPIHTDSNYGNAKILDIGKKRIQKELSEKKIVIVTGFQGIDKDNNLTTLGRGGSDTTAVALAAKFNADKCEIYKDVDGVYNNDPKIDMYAKKFDRLEFDEMLELSNSGAKILQNKSIEIAKKYYVPIFIKSIFTNRVGTLIN